MKLGMAEEWHTASHCPETADPLATNRMTVNPSLSDFPVLFTAQKPADRLMSGSSRPGLNHRRLGEGQVACSPKGRAKCESMPKPIEGMPGSSIWNVAFGVHAQKQVGLFLPALFLHVP